VVDRRKPLSIVEQVDALRRYLYTLNADCNRASLDFNTHWRKRKVCPYVERLRWQRIEHARLLRDVGTACLDQLRHALVISTAAFFPGDHITIERKSPESDRRIERYIIFDVLWSKTNGYHYDAWRLTKEGRPYERGGQTWLTPSPRIRIAKCEDAVPDDTRAQCAQFRRRAAELVEDVRGRGDIEQLMKWVQERHARTRLA
jgi:hypothetical protein